MPRPYRATSPRQFRLEPANFDDLRTITDWLRRHADNAKPTETDALKFALRETAKKILRKSRNGVET